MTEQDRVSQPTTSVGESCCSNGNEPEKDRLEWLAKVEMIEMPRWDLAQPCQDWMNYIPEQIRAAWPFLTMRERQLLYVVADAATYGEVWD